ncbi:hypothetical protein FRB95_001535 [Tulasnella sp. JGI-2019a]|nr:hypothetical protein FRB95_001535 [Tulasnella sp. JGI-2019a]
MSSWALDRRDSNDDGRRLVLPTAKRHGQPPPWWRAWLRLPTRRSTRRRLGLLFYVIIGVLIFLFTRSGSAEQILDVVRSSLADDDDTCVRNLTPPLLSTDRGLSLYEIHHTIRVGNGDPEGNKAFEGRYVAHYHSNSTSSRQRPPQQLPSLNDAALWVSCLEAYLAVGLPCPKLPEHNTPGTWPATTRGTGQQRIDLVYAYVNGSDPLHHHYHRRAKQLQATPDYALVAPQNKGSNILREFDELRYSLRSVLENFRGSAGRVTVISSQYPFPGCDHNSTAGDWTLGQLPQWLDTSGGESIWNDNDVNLRVIHHSTAFGASYNPKRPIFNSLAIESTLTSLSGISDHFIYMNDDVFFNRPLKLYDFYRPYVGPIFRMQSDLLVTPQRPRDGEWASLIYTNELLDRRFGTRSRPYLTHTAKALSKPMLEEIASIWSDELGRTAAHQFRAAHGRRDEEVEDDVSTTFLMTHYVIERWREALLWSFIVGRLGGDEDEWGEVQESRAWEELGGGSEEDTTIIIIRGKRETIEKMADEEEAAGEATKILFSSFDGYPYTNMGRTGFDQFPDFAADDATRSRRLATRCRLAQSCLSLGGSALASDVFKNVAFSVPSCGDCIISALVTKSGSLGLSAFLPDGNRKFHPRRGSPSSTSVVRLPTGKEWRTIDFSLRSALEGLSESEQRSEVSVREWAIRAMYRYRFAIGATKAMFVRLDTPIQVKVTLDRMDSMSGEDNEPALLCINDDVRWQPEAVRDMLQVWMSRKWGQRAEWEMPQP